MAADERRRFDLTKIIKIYAGEEQKEFLVHKDAITTSSSKFLVAALSNDWKEALERQIKLPETGAGILEMYLHWLYTRQLVPKEGDQIRGLLQLKLYILSDFLNDTLFCETVAEQMLKLRYGPDNTFPSLQAVSLAWTTTASDSPLRAVIKELWLGQIVHNAVRLFRPAEGDYPQQFVLEVLQSMVDHNSTFCMNETISRKTDAAVQQACGDLLSGESSRKKT